MSDAVYPQSFAVHFDEEGIDLVATTPGPAGSVELELVSDVSLTVDFADPSRISAVRVNGDEIPEVLFAMIGEERADQLARMPRNSSGKPIRLADSNAGRSEERFELDTRSRPSPRRPVARELGTLARLRSIAEDEQVPEIVRATSVLEFVNRSDNVGNGDVQFLRTSIEDVALAADLLEGTEQELRELSLQNPKSAIQLAGLLIPYENEFDSLRAARDVLMNPTPQTEHDYFGVARYAEAVHGMAAPEFDYEARIRLSAVTLSDGGLLSARVTEFEKDWWLRIVQEGTQVLLAVVPVMERGDRAIAEAILPTDLALNELDLELTNSPFSPSTSTIDAIMNAVNLGRSAVRAAMMRRKWDQEDRWLRCAEAWEAVGDVQRAKRARLYAQKGLASVGPQLLTRDVMAVFALDA